MEATRQVKTYRCASYVSTFKITGLPRYRRNEFCDTKLVAGGKIFEGHKKILAANSKYFHSIYEQNFIESGFEEIKLPPEIDAVAMQALLNYFYSGFLSLSKENIESVFRATDYMRLDPLLEICIKYMQETLDLSNCIHRYIMIEKIDFPSLLPLLIKLRFEKAASALIVDEAVKVCATADFLSLNLKLFSKIVFWCRESEKVESVYMVIRKWISHDEENRKQHLYDLVQMLPLGYFISLYSKDDELPRIDYLTITNEMERQLSRTPIKTLLRGLYN